MGTPGYLKDLNTPDNPRWNLGWKTALAITVTVYVLSALRCFRASKIQFARNWT